ncbi:hypothetical protein Ddye_028863 [Dipteronia dyeriana]|uniref:Pentatricopeptide repeat-containing protein n=1 Tax=Dipteronia dyeriana TaxID=168575 RepID=A0AAD9TE64_9ROSI|nr:hypothetical protein Ddye_028863 [Dipteronia dyeriana]
MIDGYVKSGNMGAVRKLFDERAWRLEEVVKLIKSMPYAANGIILSSFLCACGYWKDVTRAEGVDMDPLNDGNNVMFGICMRWKKDGETWRTLRD